MIHIITTGGTIEGLDRDLNKNKATASIQDFLESANVSFQFIIEEAIRKDSRSITEEDRAKLVKSIQLSDSEKILITHGTFTMEHTAKYIGNRSLNKTIVLVGSFILGTEKNTDAPFNLGYAISALQFLKSDVYIAMNGQVFHWSNVTKNLETNKFEPNE
ncbi:asparaginase domain-containing protein [Christiangramia sp.]|uniref:asparaginase domain-containing protein n=1 Tax=Christiangramia sp. TaxID=1931228 RepID=UPI0026159C39|nr:asparaginase domain-containing protein [Christiangramia sp.]